MGQTELYNYDVTVEGREEKLRVQARSITEARQKGEQEGRVLMIQQVLED